MSIGTNEGAKVYFCATPTTATSKSALSALTYVEVKSAESTSEMGPQGQDVPFTPLAGPQVQHLKGAVDMGALTITCAKDPLDPGQIAMLAAAATKFEYALKIVEADGADSNDTDTTTYARGPVMSARKSMGGANDINKRTFAMGLNVYVEVPSLAVS